MNTVVMRTVAAMDDGLRLDRWFRAHYPAISHGALEKMLRTGQIRVDGGRVKASHRVASGSTIRIPPLAAATQNERPPAPASRPEDAAFLKSITVFEDAAILALNKPFGLAVQGGAKTSRHIDAMLGALGADGERPRLVHRLDRDTSGLLIVAKTRAAAAKLSGALQRRAFEKTYWALVVGKPRPEEGTIDLPIAKRLVKSGDEDIERMTPAEEGEDAQKAITDFQTVDDAGVATFLALKPVTGRTHQLRVHCAAMGAPIVGDHKYGGEAARIEGVADKLHLFCRSMRFPHPVTGESMTLSAPLQGHMLETWTFFGFDQKAAVSWPDLTRRKPGRR